MPPARDTKRIRPKAKITPKTKSSSSSVSASRPISSSTHPSKTHVDPDIAQAEKGLNDALDKLVAIGALKPENRMDLGEYLNLEAEMDDIYSVTDDATFQALFNAKAEEEGSDDEESDGPIEPVPTRVEALRASMVLSRYLLYWNDPYARELGSMLNSFGSKTRARVDDMEDGKITDYFSRD